MAKTVFVSFIGDASKLQKATAESTQSLSKFQQSTKRAGESVNRFAKLGVLAAGAALVQFTKAAIDDRKEVARLDAQIKAATRGMGLGAEATEKFVSALQDQSVFTDSMIRGSLGRLVAVTHDQEKAQIAATFAADLASAKNITLEQATTALLGAETGRVMQLQKLGLELKDAEGKTLSLTDIVKRNKDAVDGASEAYAKGAGAGEDLKDKLGEMGESIGDKLVGPLTRVVNWVTKIVDGLSDWNSASGTTKAAIVGLGAAMTAFSIKAVIAWVAALGPVGLFLGALAAASAAVLFLSKKFDDLGAAAKAAWGIALGPAAGLFAQGGGVAGKLQDTVRVNEKDPNRFNTPFGSMPKRHMGGVMPGAPGVPGLAMLHGGERVIPANQSGSVTVIVNGSVTTERQLIASIRAALLQGKRNTGTLGLA